MHPTRIAPLRNHANPHVHSVPTATTTAAAATAATATATTTTTRKAVVATQLVEWNILLTQHESHESSVAEPSQSQHALAPQDPSGRGTCTSQGTL